MKSNNYIEKCNICKESSFSILKNYEKYYLNKCNNCNFIFSRKIPTTEELNQVYDNFKREIKWSLESLNNIARIAMIHKKKIQPNNILDIGCGKGAFLDYYKNNGIKTYFTEVGNELISTLKKKHEFVEGGIFPISKIKFDLIILTEVIEHTNDANKMINYINNLQNKNGVIYITTPNYNSLESKIYKENYSIFSYPEHLSYFTSKTLHQLLTEHNYKRIYNYSENISFYRFIDFFNKKISTNIDSNQASDKLQVIAKHSGLIYIKHFISRILRFLHLGNTIKALYIKL